MTGTNTLSSLPTNTDNSDLCSTSTKLHHNSNVDDPPNLLPFPLQGNIQPPAMLWRGIKSAPITACQSNPDTPPNASTISTISRNSSTSDKRLSTRTYAKSLKPHAGAKSSINHMPPHDRWTISKNHQLVQRISIECSILGPVFDTILLSDPGRNSRPRHHPLQDRHRSHVPPIWSNSSLERVDGHGYTPSSISGDIHHVTQSTPIPVNEDSSVKC